MTPTDFENALKEIRIVHKRAVLDERLAGGVVVRHHQPAQYRANLFDLSVHPLGFVSVRKNVHLYAIY